MVDAMIKGLAGSCPTMGDLGACMWCPEAGPDTRLWTRASADSCCPPINLMTGLILWTDLTCYGQGSAN